jgi:hypothetical protein
MAMPTPKRTPASTRFDPPSPKAKVRPATTMATSERPRAMVLVKACCSTLTAFSQGEVPVCARAGAARISVKAIMRNSERNHALPKCVQGIRFMSRFSMSLLSWKTATLRESPLPAVRIGKADGDWRDGCMRRFLDILRPSTFGASAPCTALSPNRVRPSCGPRARLSETPKQSEMLCPRELTGRNSPHTTNQPAKWKTDRVPAKYSFGLGSMGKGDDCPIVGNRPIQHTNCRRKNHFGYFFCATTHATTFVRFELSRTRLNTGDLCKWKWCVENKRHTNRHQRSPPSHKLGVQSLLLRQPLPAKKCNPRLRPLIASLASQLSRMAGGFVYT